LADESNVIAVVSLAIQRFLEIGAKLGLDVCVVTDMIGTLMRRNRSTQTTWAASTEDSDTLDTDESAPTWSTSCSSSTAGRPTNQVLQELQEGRRITDYMSATRPPAPSSSSSHRATEVPKYIRDAARRSRGRRLLPLGRARRHVWLTGAFR